MIDGKDELLYRESIMAIPKTFSYLIELIRNCSSVSFPESHSYT